MSEERARGCVAGVGEGRGEAHHDRLCALRACLVLELGERRLVRQPLGLTRSTGLAHSLEESLTTSLGGLAQGDALLELGVGVGLGALDRLARLLHLGRLEAQLAGRALLDALVGPLGARGDPLNVELVQLPGARGAGGEGERRWSVGDRNEVGAGSSRAARMDPAHSLGLSLALGQFARDGVGGLGGRGREVRRRDGDFQVPVVRRDLDADRCEHG